MKKKIFGIIVGFIIVILIIFICKNLFSSADNSRLKDNDKYKISNNEKNSISDKLEEIGNVSSVKIYKNIKIIKIIVVLDEDADLEKVKQVSNEAIALFSQKNLEYFDIEIYVESKNKESEVYPKIGYKHKSKESFAW